MLLAVLGTLGIVLIEASYVPQIARLVQRKEANDVALLFPGLNFSGRVLALIYAVAVDEPIFSVGLTFGVGVRFMFLVFVVHYRYVRPALDARRAYARQTATRPGITAAGEVVEARHL